MAAIIIEFHYQAMFIHNLCIARLWVLFDFSIYHLVYRIPGPEVMVFSSGNSGPLSRSSAESLVLYLSELIVLMTKPAVLRHLTAPLVLFLGIRMLSNQGNKPLPAAYLLCWCNRDNSKPLWCMHKAGIHSLCAFGKCTYLKLFFTQLE